MRNFLPEETAPEDAEVKRAFEERAREPSKYPRLSGYVEKVGTGSRRLIGRRSWRRRWFELWTDAEFDSDGVWLGPSLRYFKEKGRKQVGTILLGAFDSIVETKENTSRFHHFALRTKSSKKRREFRLTDVDECRRWILGIRSVAEDYFLRATPRERAALEKARDVYDGSGRANDDDDDDDPPADDGDDDDDDTVVSSSQGDDGDVTPASEEAEDVKTTTTTTTGGGGASDTARPGLSEEFEHAHRALRDKRRHANAAAFKARRATENAARETVLSFDRRVAAIAAQGVVLEDDQS